MKRFTYLVAALVLLVSGMVLRANNAAEARRLASAVVAADVAGQSTGAAETKLTEYARFHTGASASYTLQGSYDRAVAAAKAANAAASAANSQIYAEAQRLCGGKTDSVTQARCNQDYLAKHLQSVPAANVAAPAHNSFKRQVTAPLWAPDAAGALLLGGLIALMIGVVQLLPRRRKR